MGSTKPIFRDLDPDDPEPETTEIESLCMNCHSNVRITASSGCYRNIDTVLTSTGNYQDSFNQDSIL
jgi:hypothetical protein